MTPFFTTEHVKAAFECRFHFGWYAHGRQAQFQAIAGTLKRAFDEVVDRLNYRVLEFNLEPCVARALISLTPDVSPAEATRYIKGNVATATRNECRTRELWSRGWFVRSVGHANNDIVQNYVAQQYEHHRAVPLACSDVVANACYRHPGDPSELRASNHGKFEYNLHLVLVTTRRREFLDLEVADALVSYLRQVAEKKQWIPWNIEVVWNHVHLFLGVSPDEAPGSVALSLLNNAEYFLGGRYAAIRDEVERTVMQPGYYVGTVGSATTAQVKAFLAGSPGEVKGEAPPR